MYQVIIMRKRMRLKDYYTRHNCSLTLSCQLQVDSVIIASEMVQQAVSTSLRARQLEA